MKRESNMRESKKLAEAAESVMELGCFNKPSHRAFEYIEHICHIELLPLTTPLIAYLELLHEYVPIGDPQRGVSIRVKGPDVPKTLIFDNEIRKMLEDCATKSMIVVDPEAVEVNQLGKQRFRKLQL